MISKEFDPNDEGVIDRFTSALYELEAFNDLANSYAFEVLHHYYGDFEDDWYRDYIGTEDFRGMPEGRAKRTFENMFDMYWHARGEWFNTMIANLNAANLREQHRMMYLHALTNTQSWEEFGKLARRPENRVNHLQVDDDLKTMPKEA